MATYKPKKLSEYPVNTSPSNGDLVPSLVADGNGSWVNRNIPYSSLKGDTGAPGEGVPAGGSTGQLLKKVDSEDYNSQWATLSKSDIGLSDVDNTSDVNKPVSSATASAIQALYPIGSVYINADNPSNPAILLGFGTWVAFGKGSVPVGKADSGTFSTAGSSIGEETVTLTEPQLPNIMGSWAIHGQEGGTGFFTKSGYATGTTYNGGYKSPPGTSGGAFSLTNPGFNFGSNQPHNNIQPSVVVYMWKRTA